MYCVYDCGGCDTFHYIVFHTHHDGYVRHYYERIDLVLDHYRGDRVLVLLAEDHFSFLHEEFFLEQVENFDREHFVSLLADSRGFSSPALGGFLYAYMSSMSVDDQSTDFLLGKSGDLSWTSFFSFLKNPTFYFLKPYLDRIVVLPQSLAMIHHLIGSSQKNDFGILYIMPHGSKLVSVRNGFYERTDSINFGTRSLSRMFAEIGIVDWSASELSSNTLASKLVRDTHVFFVEQLMAWLGKNAYPSNFLFLVSELSHDAIFSEIFSRMVAQIFSSYVVPLSFADSFSVGYADVGVSSSMLDEIKHRLVTW